MEILRAALEDAHGQTVAGVVFILALAVLYKVTHKFTPIFLVVAGAVLGQFWFA
jgi:hypothetical protein